MSAPARKTFDRLSLELLVSSVGSLLDAGPKLALIALIHHFDDRSGRCDPGIKTIARFSGNVSEKQARRHLNTLTAMGLVASVPRAGRTCAYRFNVAAIQALAYYVNRPTEPANPGHFDAEPLSFSTPHPGHFGPPTPPKIDPRTEEGTDRELGGTGASVETAALAELTAAPSLPVFHDLKTEDPAPAAAIEPAAAVPAVALVAMPAAPAATAAGNAAVIASATLAAVNAQRTANGKREPIDPLDLVQQARQAGITPQAAAEWILSKPSRNFFRADWYRPEPAAVAPVIPAGPVELTEAGKRAQAQIARALAAPAAVSTAPAMPAVSVAAVASIVASPSSRPISAAVTLRSRAPVSVGAATGTGWACTAVERFTAGQPVSHATIKTAAAALGLSLSDLKAQRAARLAAVAA